MAWRVPPRRFLSAGPVVVQLQGLRLRLNAGLRLASVSASSGHWCAYFGQCYTGSVCKVEGVSDDMPCEAPVGSSLQPHTACEYIDSRDQSGRRRRAREAARARPSRAPCIMRRRAASRRTSNFGRRETPPSARSLAHTAKPRLHIHVLAGVIGNYMRRNLFFPVAYNPPSPISMSPGARWKNTDFDDACCQGQH